MCTKIFCVMYYDVEQWLMLHSTVKFRYRTRIYHKWIHKVSC